MADSAKPVKKSNKLGAGKKLEKKTTLTRHQFLTRLPISS
jgi:hypothetical protein